MLTNVTLAHTCSKLCPPSSIPPCHQRLCLVIPPAATDSAAPLSSPALTCCHHSHIPKLVSKQRMSTSGRKTAGTQLFVHAPTQRTG